MTTKQRAKRVFVLIALLLSVLSGQLYAKNYYFSSVSGNDSYTTTQAQVSTTPWKTITKLNSFMASLVAGDSILFKRGETFVGAINVTKAGLIFASYGTGADLPTISGLQDITSWTSVGTNLWRSTALSNITDLNVLLVNNNFVPYGKYPNTGFMKFEAHTGTNIITDNELTATPNFVGAELVLRLRGHELNRHPITAHSGTSLTFTGNTISINDGYGYIIQKSLATLDQQNEWFFDKTTKQITIYSTSAPTGVKASIVDNLFTVSGYNSIKIRNLNFIGANKLAINLVNSSSDFIENCNISFSGESAIFGSTVTNLTATGNTIYYSNNNGIDLDNTNNSNCFIRNNSIRLSGINFGMSGPSARASMIGIATTGSGHQIENNTIDSTGFCGIWFFRGSNILIKNNFVNTYCFNKDDGGGIYTWNNYPVPTTYTNNKIISNIIMNGIGASLSTNAPNYLDCDGLMLDDNTGNIEVSDNTVANVPGNGLYIHNSFNVIARGNTVFNAGRTQLNYTHNLAFINGVSSPYTTPLRNITLKNNVFVSKNLGQLAFSNSSIRNDLDSTGIADSNYFARPIDDKLTIYTSRVVNGITTASNINLENWKLLFNKDLQSKKSSRTIPAYKITSLSTNIVATIGDFSTSVNGISAYSPNNNQVLRWDSNNLLNGSGSLMLSFPAIVSGVYTSLYTPIGSISSSKNYILRFSTLGTTDTGRIRVYLRKSATPFTTLTPLQYQSYGKTRIDHEFLFTAPTTDAAAVFIIEVQQSSGTTYIDNIQFYDATIVNTNPDDYLRFEYNPTTVNKVVALPKNYVSVEGVTYSNSITLAPFTSKVLILDTSLQVNATATAIKCFGGTSTVTVTATGGTAPYTGIGTFSTTAGTYSYTVRDANGVSASQTITIAQPTLLRGVATAGTIATYGGTTTVTVSASGGTAPYTGTGTFTVSAGTYSYTVTDANNCTFTTTLTISQPPPPLSIGLSATSINCFGGSAVVTVSAVGGTAPFTGTGNFNVTAGTYTYTISDAAGLTASSSITVNQPTLLSSTVSAGTITAFGGTTTVTVSATGGTAPYTGTGTFTVSAGTYTYTVTDAKSCTSIKTITVTQPLPPLSIALSATNISCFGGSAIVTVSAVGGTAPFTGTGNFNVSAGTYNYTIRDAAGLTASSSITITQPTALAAVATVATNSNSDGTTNITVTATGGTGPYTGTGIFARTPGTYNFIITDAKGCTTNASATIIASSPLLLTHQTSPILCFGDSATVVINATGGMAPYTGTGTLKIGGNRGSLKLSFNSIISNLYSLLYAPIGAVSPQKKYVLNFTTLGTNANGVIRAALRQTNSPWGIITAYQTRNFGTSRTEHHFEFVPNSNETSASILIEVLQNAETVYIDNIAFFEADAAFNLISSNLFPSGNFDASIAGITAWSQNANHVAVWDSTSKISSVHYFTVTDALGSRTVDSVVIFNPPTPLTMTESHSDIIRFGDSSSVSITASGGVAPYTGIGKFNVAAGTYTFVVTDANGCSVSKTVTITQPVLFTSGTIATKVNCFADSSTVIVTGYGGNAPYRGNGSFRVLPGRNSLRLIFPTSVSNMYTFIYAPVGSISSTKNYSLRFSTKGSTGTGTLRAALRQTNSPWAYISTVQTASFGTAITQHEFRINAPTSEAAASFVIEVLQNSGTTYINNIALYEINADGSLSGNNLVQNGGNFENGISNVTVWSQNTNQVASADTMHIIPNRYYYTISDAANVTSVSWVDILRPTSLVVKSSAPAIPRTGGSTTVTVTATGGTAPYTGTGAFVRTAGKYTFTVTDANGCTGKTTITTAVGVATNGARVNLGDATLAMANKLNATLYPNPTQQHFNIRVQSNNLADKVTVRVWGYDGKLLIETSGSALQTYQLGDRLPSGIYNIQVLQGAESLQFKAIKAR